MNEFEILIVDDEEAMRESLSAWLVREGYRVTTASSGPNALDSLEKHLSQLVLVDMRMPGMDGLELLREIKTAYPEVMVVMITAYGSIESAIKAMKQGASDYLLKPFDPEQLIVLIEKLAAQRALKDENQRLRRCLSEQEDVWMEDLLGQSSAMRAVFQQIEDIAQSNTPVFITGETGTGKELVARAIHLRSKRLFSPFVAINCGAVTETLLESELFGHERGAFTGATQVRRGRIELADTGTLFLDEVGEISPRMQVTLLRVLEKKTFFRLGGSQEIHSDFRLICATHRDISALIESRAFRRDFYFRINVINIDIPPLRDRIEDIPLLALHFLEKFSREMGKNVEGLSPEAFELLTKYDWPGNVRELKNVMERAVVLCKEPTVKKSLLTFLRPERQLPGEGGLEKDLIRLSDVEASHIKHTLGACGGNVSKCAELLNIDRGTLSRKIKKYRIKK
ncbi:two component, sigma54 specific, transcriptional regulator, Fis family [Desulfocicer vacuolatum DSM 3385]|uniref:Two component, sigma54 specific, transcriptional regulator, Fis family n=1 Tax=Desulfocicer vacuolatum DSM 3385 TaxID=1121400 RepID=A0A1W2CKL6_9BACT|nr:sigma-54 dependent transcriptional regulator [Desulfocicer vacuolatum]SMC85566.1 two component, sigma54 specific, transcriptional regulator, Fis family [Desulfocicer vacuolatum DSM 3385]